MHERALTLVGGGAPTKADMLAFLTAFESGRMKLSQTSLELSAANGNAALTAIQERPEEQVLLQRSSLRAKWAKANKGKTITSRASMRGLGGMGVASADLGSVAGGVTSMFGALSRAAGEMRVGIASSVDGLVKQVEKEVEEEEEAKFGSLKLSMKTPSKKAIVKRDEADGVASDEEGDDDVADDANEDEDEEVMDNEDEDENDEDDDDDDDDDDDEREDDEEDEVENDNDDGEEEDDDREEENDDD